MTSSSTPVDLILHNGRFATMDPARPGAQAVAIGSGKFVAVGTDEEVMALKEAGTRVVDVRGRTVIPGLIDSHTHPIRGGLHYDLEVRWEGVPSLSDALRMLRDRARRTPAPHWVRVVGGWSEFQFRERRMPTLEEINAAAPETPVFVLHLYDRAWLNQAALRAVGLTRDTPDPPGGEVQRDGRGNPTGLLVARPNAANLYSTLARAPRLAFEEQISSTRRFLRELNRLGVTGMIDAGGGAQNYPDDYRVIEEIARRGQLTTRIAYHLFTQHPEAELDDFTRWSELAKPGQGDDFLRLGGAGEMLAYSAADFEDFLEPRPHLPPDMEPDLAAVVTHLARSRWPFRMHATYDETIVRALDVFEKVDRDVPLGGMRWFIDHAETISPRSIERVSALGGGIAVQHRMAFQGEHFVERYGATAAEEAPPIRRMLEMGIPVGAGTDATRVASYNPFVSLYWLVSGRTLGGTRLYREKNRLDRSEALRLWTVGSAWFSGESGKKGAMVSGQLADLAVLSDDYFTVPEERIKHLESVLTILGGEPVYASDVFAPLAPPDVPSSGTWSTAANAAVPEGQPADSQVVALSSHPHVLRGSGCGCFAF